VPCKCSDPPELLRTYINDENWYPQISGLVNNIGSKWWQIGDLVNLHINLQFVAQATVNNFNITGLPVAIKVDTYPSNAVVIEEGFTDPATLENGQLRYNAGNLSSLDLYNVSGNFTAGNVYTINAQIAYNTVSYNFI
jgi:hypothetical protein